MNPLVAWFADHLFEVLVTAGLLAIPAFLWSLLVGWRAARNLRRRPRQGRRLAGAVVGAMASLGVGLFAGAGLAAMGPAVLAQRGMLGEPAPELAFAFVETGAPGRLADFRGRVVLLNIWATWCPPCIAEMPELERLQADWADRGLVVLHLSDEDPGTLATWLEERPSSNLHAYARPLSWPESGRPTSYVIDREGRVRRVLLGQRSYEQFESEIRRHL